MNKSIWMGLLTSALTLGLAAEDSPPPKTPKADNTPQCITSTIFNPKFDQSCTCQKASSCLKTSNLEKLLDTEKLPKSGRDLGVGLLQGLNQVASGNKNDFSETLEGLITDGWREHIDNTIDKIKRGEPELDKMLKKSLDDEWDTSTRRIDFIKDFKKIADSIDGEQGFHFEQILHFSVGQTFDLISKMPMVKQWVAEADIYKKGKSGETSTASTSSSSGP